MWNIPTKERLSRIPKLYETEHVPLKDKVIYLHFFIAGCDWYIAEFDGHDLFWGYAILNNDFQCAEWGYVSFRELREISIHGIEVDCEPEEYFPARRAVEIDKICKGNGWQKETKPLVVVSKIEELKDKVKAGHFQHFQDLFAEVTSPYSEFFGIDPYPIWEEANGHGKN
ncbi:MAG: hypothetical protein JRJ66_02710 [Deltaproteobacteria bacterium]|nr:hypothetical protein [Deltaproteobacteria bacterium]MBW2045301.1 hypothetical protein [Deltaproteobacteria bacterium]